MLPEAELREIEARAGRLGPAGADLAALVAEVRRLKLICWRMVEAAAETDYDRVYAVVATIGDEVDGEDGNPFWATEEVPMADEKVKVDMSKHQRPYTRGPQVRKNLEEEFARLFPGEAAPGAGEERYEYMERKIRDRANQRKAEADD